jgi:hypothetical protein
MPLTGISRCPFQISEGPPSFTTNAVHGLSQSLRTNSWILLLDYDSFLPDLFQFIIHQPSDNVAIYPPFHPHENDSPNTMSLLHRTSRKRVGRRYMSRVTSLWTGVSLDVTETCV